SSDLGRGIGRVRKQQSKPGRTAGRKATGAEMGAQKSQAKGQAGLEMKELVREASAALARLDAERLEELARCCQALNRDLRKRSGVQGPREPGAQLGAALVAQVREAAG